jgi:hypothetical protein
MPSSPPLMLQRNIAMSKVVAIRSMSLDGDAVVELGDVAVRRINR